MDSRSWLLKLPGAPAIMHQSDQLILCDGARKNIYRNKATSVAMLLVFVLLIGGGIFLFENYTERSSIWWSTSEAMQIPTSNDCKVIKQCPISREPLPSGIVQKTSDLEMRPLWTDSKKQIKEKSPQNLLAMAVGINQRESVDQIVKKFPANNFSVMLFHYDGITDQWNDLEWSRRAVHVTAGNQTKWWFAKRFLHPDIVASYNYIFLWDEDLGVENFRADRYLAIMEDEGLEISQPGLDLNKSEVHHRITVRGHRSRAHRRIYKLRGSGQCHANSTEPPCTGWVEMMAPVFSRAAWRCAWQMIQNDLIHAWGVDMKLGYCAQGDRSKKVGVIDKEYIVHKGIPSLGGPDKKAGLGKNDKISATSASPPESAFNGRAEVRRQSYSELDIFNKRWSKAVEQDKCWVDPYPKPSKKSVNSTQTPISKYMTQRSRYPSGSRRN